MLRKAKKSRIRERRHPEVDLSNSDLSVLITQTLRVTGDAVRRRKSSMEIAFDGHVSDTR